MFEKVMERIHETTNLHTQSSLALCLGIRQSSMPEAKNQEEVAHA